MPVTPLVTTTSRGFAAAVQTFVAKTGVRIGLVMKRVGFEGFRGVILLSPVDTGRFRASWRIAVDARDLSVEPPRKAIKRTAEEKIQRELDIETAALKIAPVAPADLARAELALAPLSGKRDATIYITNNLSYAQPLDTGHSDQAPNGITIPVVQKIEEEFYRIVEQVKAQVP